MNENPSVSDLVGYLDGSNDIVFSVKHRVRRRVKDGQLSREDVEQLNDSLRKLAIQITGCQDILDNYKPMWRGFKSL